MHTPICTQCEYDLRGLPGDAPCPECASTLRGTKPRPGDGYVSAGMVILSILTVPILTALGALGDASSVVALLANLALWIGAVAFSERAATSKGLTPIAYTIACAAGPLLVIALMVVMNLAL